jgi:hypothetical protein
MCKNHPGQIVKGDEIGKRGLSFSLDGDILSIEQRNVAKIFSLFSVTFPRLIPKINENIFRRELQNEEESIGYVTCYNNGSNCLRRMRKQDRDHR